MNREKRDANGVPIERWDDETRTVTGPDGNVIRSYTSEESAEVDREQAQQAQLTNLDERVAALETWRAEQQTTNPNQPDAPT